MAWHPDGKNLPLRQWEKDVQVGVEEWTQAINDKTDLACRACYSMGPWMFIYVPNCVETGRSLNPVLVQCPCGAALTFEEGFASLCEIAMDSGFSKWKPMHVSHYFALSAAYGGSDFRETYESLWRARVLMDAPDGKDVTDRTIDLAKKQAWVSCVRVFRGTPTELEDGPVLTMNKDLAYLNGKLDALKFLDKVAGDKDAIKRVFAGKYDPNNSLQAAIVDKYVTI